jgi:hypothetical protein
MEVLLDDAGLDARQYIVDASVPEDRWHQTLKKIDDHDQLLKLLAAVRERLDGPQVAVENLLAIEDFRQKKPAGPRPQPGQRQEFIARNAKLFISYSHRDERYREQLVSHLAGLRRQGVIADWHDRKIVPGEQWRDAIDQELDDADCVLLLVSSDFLASDYCYSIEMQRTLGKHRQGRVLVIPVIVRPADWQHTPLGELEALPKDAKPVVEWARRDRAWLNVIEGIRRALAPSAGE